MAQKIGIMAVLLFSLITVVFGQSQYVYPSNQGGGLSTIPESISLPLLSASGYLEYIKNLLNPSLKNPPERLSGSNGEAKGNFFKIITKIAGLKSRRFIPTKQPLLQAQIYRNYLAQALGMPFKIKPVTPPKPVTYAVALDNDTGQGDLKKSDTNTNHTDVWARFTIPSNLLVNKNWQQTCFWIGKNITNFNYIYPPKTSAPVAVAIPTATDQLVNLRCYLDNTKPSTAKGAVNQYMAQVTIGVDTTSPEAGLLINEGIETILTTTGKVTVPIQIVAIDDGEYYASGLRSYKIKNEAPPGDPTEDAYTVIAVSPTFEKTILWALEPLTDEEKDAGGALRRVFVRFEDNANNNPGDSRKGDWKFGNLSDTSLAFGEVFVMYDPLTKYGGSDGSGGGEPITCNSEIKENPWCYFCTTGFKPSPDWKCQYEKQSCDDGTYVVTEAATGKGVGRYILSSDPGQCGPPPA